MKIAKYLLLISLVAGVGLWGYNLKPTTQAAPAIPPPVSAPVSVPPDVTDLFNDTNNYRVANGLAPLRLSPTLTTTATAKCDALSKANEFNHTLSDGRTFQSFIVPHIPPRTHYDVGENLAEGFTRTSAVAVSQAITDGWIGSPGHRANLLRPQYDAVGYAVCQSPSYKNIVVQHFWSL